MASVVRSGGAIARAPFLCHVIRRHSEVFWIYNFSENSFGGPTSKFALSLFATSSVWGIAVHAQLLNNPVQDYINKTNLLNNILSDSRATAMSQQAQTDSASSRPNPASAPAPEPTRFTHSGSALLPRELAAKAGSQSEAYFNSLIALYEQTARKDGFPANDLACAMEYFLANTSMTYDDLHDVEYSKDPRIKKGKDSFERITLASEKKLLKVRPYQERAAYQQFKTKLGAQPSSKQMTDRQKHQLAELLAITFGVNFKAYMDAVDREDDRAIAAARQQAKASLEKLTGAPVGRIKFTPTGLQM